MENQDDVKDAMRDYYKSKESQDIPKSVKKSKSKKKLKAKKDKKINKKPPTEITYNDKPQTVDSLVAPNTISDKKRPSVDYMEEEKDLDFEEYQAKNEEVEAQQAQKQRRSCYHSLCFFFD